VQRVLQAATKDSDNADVRDRAYIYWRLLSSDPTAAKVRQKLCSLIVVCCFGTTPSYILAANNGRLGAEEMAKRAAEYEAMN
jgi:hypothetical protein